MIDNPELAKEKKRIFIPPLGVVERESTNVYPVDPPWLAKALSLIDDNLDRHIALADLAAAAGISQSAYLRHLITGFVPKEHPPLDYFAFMRSLYSLANNLNQIAQKAHVLGVIDVQRYDKYAKMSADAVRAITDAMIVPREMTPEEREGFKHAETE